MNLKLALVVIEEDGAFVVQSLTTDIAAQGETISEALFSFARTWEAYQVLRLKGLHDMPPPAPLEYWRLVDKAQP